MTPQDPVLNQFKEMGQAAWFAKQQITEMAGKGWVVLYADDKKRIDYPNTITKIIDLLLSRLDLFEVPEFVGHLENVFERLDGQRQNVAISTIIKTCYSYLRQNNIATLPLTTQLFLLKHALEKNDSSIVITILQLIPRTDETKKFLDIHVENLQKVMRYLIENDQAANYELIFTVIRSFNLQLSHYTSILLKNPYQNTQKLLAQLLNGNGYQLVEKEFGQVTKVKLIIAHNNQCYKIAFRYWNTDVPDNHSETILNAVKIWIDQGLPCEQNGSFTFKWSPTLEQYAAMLKEGKAKECNNLLPWYLQDSAYLSLIVNRYGVINEQLKRYYLASDFEHFRDHELEFIFNKISTMDQQMAIHFFKLAGEKNFSPQKKLDWMQKLLIAFPILIKELNDNKAHNIPLSYITQREWELAKLFLDAGWDPIKCPNGAEDLENTLLTMASHLDSMGMFRTALSYTDKELSAVGELIQPLCRFIAKRPELISFQFPDDPTHRDHDRLAYQILTHVIPHGKHVDRLKWLVSSGFCRHPHLLLFIAQQHPESITSHTMTSHLDHYLKQPKNTFLNAALRLIEMGCPVKTRPIFSGKQSYRDPFRTFLAMLRKHDPKKADEPLDQQLCLQLFDVLVRPDFNFSYKANGKKSGLPPMTYLEKFYLTEQLPQPLRFDILVRMVKLGGEITSRMMRRIKLEVKLFPHSGIIECLKQSGHIQNWEAAENPSKLLLRAQEAIAWLEKVSVQSYFVVSLVEFGKIRQLKKELKAAATESDIQAAYETLSKLYDVFVLKHMMLKELRDISQKLRQKTCDPLNDERIVRLYSLWGPNLTRDYETSSKQVSCLQGASRKLFWNDLVERIYEGNDKSIQANLYNRGQIVWFHGTKFSSIPPIKKTNALVPTGQLYEKGGVPFAGELCGSHKDRNKNHLSGHCLSNRWEDIYQIFGAATHFLVSYLYATQMNGYGINEKYFDPEKALARLTIEDSSMYIGSHVLMADILRLRISDPDADKKLQPFKKYIDDCRNKFSLPSESLQQLHHALTVKFAYTFTPEEAKALQRTEPVVFASLTIDTIPDRTEYYAEGSQELGKDIQIAFTEEALVEELQEELKDRGVQVFSFDVAFYLESMQMIAGTRQQMLKSEPLNVRLASELKWNILPRYSIPFPKSATNTAHYARGCKNHEEYLNKVNCGLVLPRTDHGPLHAARATLWTQVLYTLYAKQIPEITWEDPYFIGLAAASHDIARLDEGIDFWDKESSLFLKSYLQASGYTTQEIAPYVEAIANKDPKDGKYSTFAQLLVHDADVLEIIRVLKDRSAFRVEKLQFPSKLGMSEKERETLLDEIFSFIRWTESKKWQLVQLDDLFAELIELLKNKADDYPLLNGLLG